MRRAIIIRTMAKLSQKRIEIGFDRSISAPSSDFLLTIVSIKAKTEGMRAKARRSSVMVTWARIGFPYRDRGSNAMKEMTMVEMIPILEGNSLPGIKKIDRFRKQSRISGRKMTRNSYVVYL